LGGNNVKQKQEQTALCGVVEMLALNGCPILLKNEELGGPGNAGHRQFPLHQENSTGRHKHKGGASNQKRRDRAMACGF
jgi:hypothetical protein